jgi:hypothetical protein
MSRAIGLCDKVTTFSFGADITGALFTDGPFSEFTRYNLRKIIGRAFVSRGAGSAELSVSDREPHVILSAWASYSICNTIRTFISRFTDFAFRLTSCVLIVASNVFTPDAAFSRHFWLRTGVLNFTDMTFEISFSRILYLVCI